MRRRGLLAAGLGAYALALIATAPATLADAGLLSASHGRLRLAEARGTLWSGSGRIELRDTRAATGVSRRLAWRVLPESLWRASLVLELATEPSTQGFPVAISPYRVELANAEVSLPAEVLALLVPRLAPLGLAGDVLVSIPRLLLTRDRMAGNAILRWHAASSALTPVSPLGDYEVRFDGAGAAVNVSLSTLEGPLQLDGRGRWSRGAPPSFLATARVPVQHREQLAPLLRLIAIEGSAGSFVIDSAKTAF
jgi:general secretion pathway protein N